MNAVAKINSSLPAMAMNEKELMFVLRSSLYVGAKEESIQLVVNYCKAAGLDIMQKPVHLVPMYDSKAKEMRDVVMPGIGLYRTQASRSGEMAGITEPEFGEDINCNFEAETYLDNYSKQKTRDSVSVTYPKWCKVTVKKLMPNGMVAEYHAKELWLENYATASKDSKQPNAMWKKRPYGQLAKCAEAQALRKAFPELGSMPTAEEMEGKEIEVNPLNASSVQASSNAQSPKEIEIMADEAFNQNLAKFKGFTEKKPLDDVLVFIESKGKKLTDEQKEVLASYYRKPAVIEHESAEAATESTDEFLADYNESDNS